MKFTRKIGLGLAAGMLASTLAFTAQAGVIAYSALEITSVRITSGGDQITTPINITNATSSRSTFDSGAFDSHSNPSDALLSCVGNCGGIAQNDFSQVSAGNPNLHFARGDALLTGSILNPAGANAYTVAETQLTHQETSNAGGEISTTSFFWTIDIDGELGDVTLEFDALGELLASSDVVDGSAQADFNWDLTLRDVTSGGNGTFVASYSPDELNQSVAVFGIDSATYSIDDSFVFTVSGLLADHRYRLIINHNSDVEANLPEPASMAMLGLGLLGLGGMAVRRRKSA